MNFDIKCIKKIIVYQLIYSSDNKKFEVKYPGHFIDNIPEDITHNIRDKIKLLLSKKIVMGILPDSEIFDITQRVPQMNDEKFTAESIKVAEKLAEAHQAITVKKHIVLIVMYAQNSEKKDIVFFVKAGVGTGIEAKPDGLKILDNVIFTNTDYYKIGAFLHKKNKQWVSVLYDNSATKGTKEKAGKYFYETFLGLYFTNYHNNLVKKFYNVAKKIIEKHYTGPELVNKMTDLLFYLRSHRNKNVNIIKFGKKYLRENIFDEYKALMEKQKIPIDNILKNTVIIETYLKNRIIHFENGININIPNDKFEKDFQLLDISGDKTKVLDKLKELDTKGWNLVAIKGSITPKK